VTRRVFQQRRKQLVNALQPLAHERGATAAAWLAAAELDGTRRPGTLTRPELARLAAVVAARSRADPQQITAADPEQ
jgi:16S rRNA A1518/A1519 N6-dimethyltransferase RsmA/KsgA/DIM1 with predicted DNA glycosylase/AP lyase activity